MKCKLLRMSLLCLLLLFLFCINVSFASVNYTYLEEFNFNGNPKEMLQQCIYKISNFSLEEYGNKIASSNQTAWDLLLSVFNNSNYVSFSYSLSSQGLADSSLSLPNAMNFMCFSNDNWNNGNGYNFTLFRKSMNETRCTYSSITSQSLNGSINSNYISKFLYVSNKWYKAIGNNWVVPNINRNLIYNNFKTNTISVNYSGEYENFIKADYSKNISSWRLGSFSNFDSSDVDTIYGYLASFQGSTSQAIYSEVIASFQWKKNIGTYSNGLSMPDTSEHAIYLSSSRIYYNQGYTLYFNAYKNGVEQEITNQFTYLYFVPLGDTSTSGDLINPDASTNLDWDFINSTEHLYDYSSGNIEFLLNTNFSGDFSGDLFKQLGYVGPSDTEEHYGFIHNVFNSLIAALIDTNTNVTLPIEVHSYQKTLYASDFTTPETPLKGFCRLFLIFGFIILFYQFLVKLYLMFLTLDLSGVLKQTQIDFTLFM